MRGKQTPGPDGATVTSWRGYVRYACTACPFDTLDPAKFADHWRQVHGSLETHADERPAFAPAQPIGGEQPVED